MSKRYFTDVYKHFCFLVKMIFFPFEGRLKLFAYAGRNDILTHSTGPELLIPIFEALK